MNVALQWLPTIIAIGVFVLSALKTPKENASLNGGTVKSYAEAAKMAGEDARAARQEANETKQKMFEMERRLTVVERKKFRCVIDFEIGDPPTVGEVKVEPILPPDMKKTAPIKKGRK